MAKNQIKYWITTGFDPKGQKAAQKGLMAIGKTAIGAGIGITAATTALTSLNRLLKESVQAAIADEKAQSMLNKTLQNAGFGYATGQVAAFIDKMQLATGVSEDELRPAFQNLFNALGSVSEAQNALNIAMDVAAATGKDLKSVTAAFGKAAAGSNTAIGRLGLGISKADLKSKSFDQILGIISQKFKGSAATAAETMAGKMDRLKTAFQEAKEELGKGMLEAFDQFAKNGGTSIEEVQNKMIALGTATGEVFIGIAAAWKSFSDTVMNSPLGKLLELVLPFLDAGGEWPAFIRYNPLLRPWLELFDALRAYGESKKPSNNTSTVMENYRLDQLNAKNKTRLTTNEKITDETKKQADELAKQLAAKRKMMMYDQELIQIAAAKTRNISAESRARLNDLEKIALERYGIDTSGMAMKGAGGASSALGIGATIAGQSLAQGLAAGLSLADATAGARYAGQGAAQYYGAMPTAPNVVVNLNGPTIGTDVDAVVLDAVNKAMRSGGALRGNTVAL